MLIAAPHSSSVLHRFSTPARAAWTDFQPGDHVRVWRGLYWHHAIYVGNGAVIEFGSGIFGGVVSYTQWKDFAKSERVCFVRRIGMTAVDRAQGLLGRGGFDLLTANCEHFATWCSTGRWESTQINTFQFLASVSLIVVIARLASQK